MFKFVLLPLFFFSLGEIGAPDRFWWCGGKSRGIAETFSLDFMDEPGEREEKKGNVYVVFVDGVRC